MLIHKPVLGLLLKTISIVVSFPTWQSAIQYGVKERDTVPPNIIFYCVTIAYHVELNADLGEAAGIWPKSKKNRRLVFAIASGCTLVELF